MLPAKAIENLRLEAARLMLADSRHPLETIAQQTGFADRERMRRAFVRDPACHPKRCGDRFEGPANWAAASPARRCARSVMRRSDGSPRDCFLQRNASVRNPRSYPPMLRRS